MLTGKQRYWQAKQKAHLTMMRNVRHYMEGKREDSGPCGMDLADRFIIAEFERMQREIDELKAAR